MRIRFDRVLLQTGAIAALLVFAMPAFAQSNADTASRLNRLENELQTLNRAVYKGEQPPAGMATGVSGANAADIQNRISQLEMSIQALTGKIEEQSYEINRLKELDSRMRALETRTPGMAQPVGGMDNAGYGASDSTPQPATRTSSTYTYSSSASNGAEAPAPVNKNFTMTDPDAAAPNNAPTAGQLGTVNSNASPGSPTAEYDLAFNMLRNQDYAGAQTAFETFIKKYPDNSLLPNAMYWMGETYYVRNDFVPATKIFVEAYQKYPKGSKAPDNLLKLGLSLAGQGKTKDACVALGQLKKQYPAGAAPVLTRGDQEIERLKCNAQQ